MVKFCPDCSNLFGHRINDETQKLEYECLICGYVEPVNEHCIVTNELNASAQDYPIHKNLVYDRTLPRTQKPMITSDGKERSPCPNPQCSFVPNETQKYPEIIIFQYNPTMLKTAYICTSCNTYWKN